MTKFFPIILFSIVLFQWQTVLGQEKTVPEKKRSSEMFQFARKLALDGKRDEARAACKEILMEQPDYYDARILIGRSFAWDGNFEEARKELQLVLDQDFDNKDAILAMIDVEHWAKNLSKAIFYCEYGQSFYPSEEIFMIQKAKLLLEKGEESKSLQSLNELLELHPESEEGRKMLAKYKSARMKHKLIYQHDFERFSKPYLRRWHVSSFQLARRNNWGSVIGKVNLGDLVAKGEEFWSKKVNKQFEVDAYPRISSWNYFYLNYGYSPDNLFPRHRAGAEWYQKLPAAFEVSAGFRYLRFQGDSGGKNVYIYTGSVGKYYRNYWFSFRTYLSPKNNNVSQSYWLISRRYLRDSENYIGLELGSGVSPDDARGNVSSLATYKYNSYGVKLAYQDQFFSKRLTYLIRMGYENEEFEINNDRNVLTLSVKLSYQF